MTTTAPPSADLEHHLATAVDEGAARARWDALSPHRRTAAAVRRRQVRLAARPEVRRAWARLFHPLGLCVIAAAASSLVIEGPALEGLTIVLGSALLVVVAILLGYLLTEEADQALPQVIPPADDTSLDYQGPDAGWQIATRHLHVRVPDAVTTTEEQR